MRDPLRVFLGFDSREPVAYAVARHSILSRASVPVSVTPIELERNEQWGLLRRPRETLSGQMFDTISDAPMSTEFALSRFLTPFLAQKGWALFADSDTAALADIAELFALADDRYALMCVKHQHEPVPGVKMDGQRQTAYPRKNWSSVMLFNCEHPANYGLGLTMLNQRPGRDLHRFCWLFDEHIGALPPEWNWLVGVQPKPAAPKLAHFTLGGPWFPNWRTSEHDEIWERALQAMCRSEAIDSLKDHSPQARAVRAKEVERESPQLAADRETEPG